MKRAFATTLITKLTVSNTLDGDDVRASQSLPKSRGAKGGRGRRRSSKRLLSPHRRFLHSVRKPPSEGKGRFYRCTSRGRFPICRAFISK